MLQIKEDLKTFILFPYLLNKNNSNWVPPLLLTQKQLFNKKHLFWKRNPHQFFLAYKDGRCVGRITAFVNQEHNAFHYLKEACFGFLEAENDIQIFRELLITAENFCKAK